MRWIKNKFMNITIRSKIIWSYFLVALIPFLIFASVITFFTLRQAENNIFEHTDQMLSQVKTSIDVYIRTIEKTSNYITEEMEDSLFFNVTQQEDNSLKSEKDRIINILQNIADTHSEVAGILIATENDMYISTGMTRISRDSFTEESWYRKAADNPNELQIISNIAGRNIITNESYSVDNVFSLSKAIIDNETGEVLGVILLDIKHDIISQSIQSITLGEKGFIFVIDDNQQVVYTPINTITYRVNPNCLEIEEASVTTKIGRNKYQIRQEDSRYTGWKIVGVFSLDEILGPIDTIFYILLSCLFLNLVCIIFFSLKISQTITKPIIQLKRLMKRAEIGDLKVRFEVKYQDEVSVLGGNFNQMLGRIEELVQMVYIEQKSKRTAELKVIQEQIKPHFLYNTLDTINWMAREYKADDIVMLVDALTSMYRIGLSHGKDYITLEEEIKYVSNYLYIQKIRYQTKLNYEIIEDDRLQRYVVPKLILQPLIENAIYHGIKTKRGEGHLIIRTKKLDDNFMELVVADDGSGMTQDKVDELNRILKQPLKLEENQSFGMFYIKERLQIRYGNRFSVFVTSTKDIGTEVTIRIPQKTDKEDEDMRYEK